MQTYCQLVAERLRDYETVWVGDDPAYIIEHDSVTLEAAAGILLEQAKQLTEAKKIFQWIVDNPGCHPANIMSECKRFLKENV